MANRSNQKISLMIIWLLFLSITISPLENTQKIRKQDPHNISISQKDDFSPLHNQFTLNSYTYLTYSIHIDNNWSDTANYYQWCRYENDQYIISNIELNSNGGAFCLRIENTNEPFLIQNFTLSNGTTGIYIENVSNGRILNCVIKDIFGLNGIPGSNGSQGISGLNGTASQINGTAGLNGMDGGAGSPGLDSYGIILVNSSEIVFENNQITRISAGHGSNGGTGGKGGLGGLGHKGSDAISSGHGGIGGTGGIGANGGTGGMGADGGSAFGIYTDNSSYIQIKNTWISHVIAGNGGMGGRGGDGGFGGDGGPGGDGGIAWGDLGGNGGPGGDGGIAGNGADSGLGGDGFGLYFHNSSFIFCQYNSIINISAGSGGLGGEGGDGGQGGKGGNGGPGGSSNGNGGHGAQGGIGNRGGNGAQSGAGGAAIAIALNLTNNSIFEQNYLKDIFGGSGGNAGFGGTGGSGGHGGHGNTGAWIMGTGHGGNGGSGALAGHGGNGGTGAQGGNALGISTNNCWNNSINENFIRYIIAGYGGDGGKGGNPATGGVGGRGAAGTGTNGNGGHGGAGGNGNDSGYGGNGYMGGDAYGILLTNSTQISLTYNNLFNISSGSGGAGGYGGSETLFSGSGDGGEGGAGGEAEILSGGIGGNGGVGGNGGNGNIGGNGGDAGCGILLDVVDCLEINNTANRLSPISLGLFGSRGNGGYQGFGGMGGSAGYGGTIGTDGTNGIIGNNGIQGDSSLDFGFLYSNSNNCRSINNSIHPRHNFDNGTFNIWNNTASGNFWSFYASLGPGYTDSDLDNIGDLPYELNGTANSVDERPYWGNIAPIFYDPGLPQFQPSNETLNLHDYLAFDDNSDQVNLYIFWYVEGVLIPSAINQTQLHANNFTRMQTIRVEITPNDGKINGTQSNFTVSILNWAPQITALAFTSDLVADQDASINYSALDGDDDQIQVYIYWRVNANPILTATNSTVLPRSTFRGNDVISVLIIPSDGMSNGTLVSIAGRIEFSRVQDSDGDGLSDWDETYIYSTDPYNPDTDGDGFTDGDEVKTGTNPLDLTDFPRDDTSIADMERIVWIIMGAFSGIFVLSLIGAKKYPQIKSKWQNIRQNLGKTQENREESGKRKESSNLKEQSSLKEPNNGNESDN